MRRTFIASIVFTAMGVTGFPVLAASQEANARAKAAIITAIRARMGARANIRVESLDVRGDGNRPLIAVPTPGAVTGSHIRFVLRSGDAPSMRVGEASAIVFVTVPHVRAMRPLGRNEPIESDAIIEENRDVGAIFLQQLPRLDIVAGAIPVRDIAAGELVTSSLVAVAPLVRSGEKVLVSAAIAGVEVHATLIAAQSGVLGDVIRCVNPETNRTMTARIVGRGSAEVVDAF